MQKLKNLLYLLDFSISGYESIILMELSMYIDMKIDMNIDMKIDMSL